MSLRAAFDELRARQMQELFDLLNRQTQERIDLLFGLRESGDEDVTPQELDMLLAQARIPLLPDTPALMMEQPAPPLERGTAAKPAPVRKAVTPRCLWCGKRLPKKAKPNQKFCSNGNVCKMQWHRNPAKRNPKYACWLEIPSMTKTSCDLAGRWLP